MRGTGRAGRPLPTFTGDCGPDFRTETNGKPQEVGKGIQKKELHGAQGLGQALSQEVRPGGR